MIVGAAVNDAQPDEDQVVVYTISAKNDGPGALARSIVISGVLPRRLTFVSAAAEQGSYAAATGLWMVGDLAQGVTKKLTLSARVNIGVSGQTIVNRAELAAISGIETNASNNAANIGVTVNGADMSVVASVNDSQPGEGQVIAYTIDTKNNGPAALASGVMVRRSAAHQPHLRFRPGRPGHLR